MKYSTNSSDAALFCEQVHQLTTMYEQWNDCERTVVIYALFKRLPFANLKFLVHSVEHHLKQSFNTPHRLSHFEDAANSISFLNKLIHKYNTLITITSSNDKIDRNSDLEIGSDGAKNLEDDLVSKYASKEEIIIDLLMYLPLLRPNNDEGKKAYMMFVPVLIEDSIKHNLPIQLVQQILSYLLIHPAIKSDDRKALNQWLKQLEDHISSSYAQSSSSTSYNLMPSDNASSFLSTASSISSASSSSSASSTTWPTTVSQALPNAISFKTKREQDIWDLRNFPVTQEFCDDLNQAKYPTPIGNNKNTSQASLNTNSSSSNKGPILNSTSIFDTNDEHHISFSKNGKEIVDFNNEFGDATKNGSMSVTVSSISNDYLTVPNIFSNFDMYGYGGDGFSDDGNAVKTRRSNSLTTPTACGAFAMSSSAENLSNLQKPRSFSLSMESSRNALVSSGSDTRLDDYNKPGNIRYNNSSHHDGMGHIGIWLKSLRLHKYFWLFSNMSYEQMLDMSEEYLENLGVTKGARHKLVICIQKLGERVPLLKQIEKELIEGSRPLRSGLDELANIVLTPMKPINTVPNDDDVATHVLRVLDTAFQTIYSIKFYSNAEEECVNFYIWLIDKVLHHDAFLQQTAHLKELKYKTHRLKMNVSHNKVHFAPKGTNKIRWNNVKPLKGNSPSMSSDNQPKIHRKSSVPYYNMPSYNMQNQSGANKSSSCTNLGSNQASNPSNFQRSASREKLNQFSLMQQQHHQQFNQQMTTQGQQNTHAPPYHRHSLNNLMPFNSAQQQFNNRRNSSCGSDRIGPALMSPLGNHDKNLSDSGLSTSMNSTAPSASDINSRLESLCRQMTEQAIN